MKYGNTIHHSDKLPYLDTNSVERRDFLFHGPSSFTQEMEKLCTSLLYLKKILYDLYSPLNGIIRISYNELTNFSNNRWEYLTF